MSAVRRAVIVSTARTGLAKSFRGGFNKTHGAALAGDDFHLFTSPLHFFTALCHQYAGHAIKSAIEKAGIDKGLVDDVILGCGMPEG